MSATEVMNSPDQVTRFVILMVGRSGSSYLTELLSSHPSICAMGEKPGPWKAPKQLAWTRRYLTEDLPLGKTAVGFKIKRKDIKDQPRFAELLRELQARIILLRRKNVVKLTVSWYNSQRLFNKTGQWNLYDERDRLPPLVVDETGFADRLKQMEQAIAALEGYVMDLALPTYQLYYEDLLYDEHNTLQRIFAFLGVEYVPTTSSCKKNTSDDLRNAVANFDELRSRYLGSRYLSMFDEVM